MAIDMEQFKATFIEESYEGLDVMENTLLNMDAGTADPESINAIFRAAHSIKGGAATFGFTDIAEFTHVAETLLDQIRNGERNITQMSIDIFLESVDCVRNLLEVAQGKSALDQEKFDYLKAELENMLGAEAPAKEAVGRNSGSGGCAWRIRFKPNPQMLSTGNDVVRMFRELEELGEMKVTLIDADLPSFADLVPQDCYLAWDIEIRGEISRSQLEEVFAWVEDECELTLEELKSATDSSAVIDKTNKANATPKPVAAKAKSIGGDASSIRVGIEKVDDLINMVGELVITQSMLNQLGGNLEEMDNSLIDRMRDGLSQLERNTRELQESVMRIRMLPISFVFNRFPRMVHDMCIKLDKKIELKVTGEGTELDKTVMEKIGDPLVHLVRNSCDHGVEMPEKRLAAGKPETGSVHLNAYHQGGDIVIQIIDDGAGLSRDKIVKKAIERGLLESDIGLADEQVYDFLFQPGFSTAETITDVSGRGVGMDVVRKNIQALGGRVDVSSVEGSGTTFTIRLPLTLAILDGQLVEVHSQCFIVPLISIIESLQLRPGMVRRIAGRAELCRVREEYIPLIRLHKTFAIDSRGRQFQEDDDNNGLVVVVEAGDGRKAGLFVDDLLSQQQVVIKSLETNFKSVKGVSGATILGDGTVALIVDIASLINLAHQGIGRKVLQDLNQTSKAA